MNEERGDSSSISPGSIITTSNNNALLTTSLFGDVVMINPVPI
jgi:hypothetical protein